MEGGIANAFAVETSGNSVVSFPWRSRQLVVTNDHSANVVNLTIGSTRLTVRGDESVSVNLWINGLTVSATSDWRLWAFG